MDLPFLKHHRLLGLLVILLYISSFCAINNNQSSRLTFLVTFNGNVATDSTAIILKWSEISNKCINIKSSNILIHDLNNSNIYIPIIYTNDKGKIDKLVFYIKLNRNEPLRPFEIITSESKQNGNKIITDTDTIESNNFYSITKLQTTHEYSSQNNLEGKWSEKIAESVMKTYPDPSDLDIYKNHDWNYTNGFMINAIYELYKKTGNEKYFNYVKKWYSYFILNTGQIDSTKYDINKFELDNILPARTLFGLYKETGEEKYKIAIETIAKQLALQPRTHEGGFWHKNSYKWQMWLDGVYMADVFYLQYAETIHRKELTIDATKQYLFINKHLYDPKTGLYYHGWDESKNKIWANPETGVSQEFWGRGIGWYEMALIDGLDFIPKQNPYRDSLTNIFRNLSFSLSKYQDSTTNLWFQVVNKSKEKGNWTETSASTMFAYAFAKGYNKNILDSSYKVKALKAFDQLKDKYIYFDSDGKLYLTGTVKVGTLNFKTSDGSYKYYISVDRRINDFKGLAALLYLCIELEFVK